MTEILEKTAQSPTVEVELNYAARMDYKPQAYISSDHKIDPAERAKVGVKTEPHSVSIKDGSKSPSDTSLDREGFIMVHHPSAVADFKDPEEVKRVYFAELRSLLISLTGADRIEFPFMIGAYRNSDPGSDESLPAINPHIDYSEKGVTEYFARAFPDRPTDVRRWAVYNIWRCLSPEAPVDWPLAVLDGQTIAPDDWVPVDTHFDNKLGTLETVVLRHNAEHRWTYFSGMKRDDVLLFKAYDSDRSKYFPAGHVSFKDPSCPPPPGGHNRLSYEIRAYACWY